MHCSYSSARAAERAEAKIEGTCSGRVHGAGYGRSVRFPFCRDVTVRKTMTPHSLGLLSNKTSGVGWHWLRSAVEMAAMESGNCPLAADVASSGWTRNPRLATRTPGADAGSVSAARHFTIATLRQWGLAGGCGDVALVGGSGEV